MNHSESSTTSYALFVKRDCPTCQLIEPVMAEIAAHLGDSLTIYSQDDPDFPAALSVVDDTELEQSFHRDIEIVPTLIRRSTSGDETRIEGWDRAQWREFLNFPKIGEGLIEFKPGCGSKTQDPGMEEQLELRYGATTLQARQIDLASAEDELETCYDRGWSDGLPVVPPTQLRVLRMLRGASRSPDELIGCVPPDNAPCTVEKVAINAVLAGCKPEYFPVVLAAVEAALKDEFCMHGLLCTTYFSAPVVIVNGAVAARVGVNSGVNALGQGSRANATIGRALQLLIRNVGGGVPGGIDRATMGNPGKYSYCFAEDESDEQWPSLAQDRGYARGESVVSLFAGEGLQGIVDQQSRTPESLARSMAASLRSVAHTKLFGMADAILLVSPEHRRVFREGGWSKADLRAALYNHLMVPGESIMRGADGIAEGMPERFKDKILNKFRDDGLHIVTLGGTAGMFSAIIGGWVASGERGSQLVSQTVEP